jgi:hypothetical protein
MKGSNVTLCPCCVITRDPNPYNLYLTSFSCQNVLSKSIPNAIFMRKSMRYYVAIFKVLPAGCANTFCVTSHALGDHVSGRVT